VKPIRYDVVKTYPRRGPLQRYRLAAATSFPCFRCSQPKTSKLITVFRDDWSRLLCNACVGFLLSIHDVRSGDDETEDKARALADQLVELVAPDDAHRVEAILVLRERRAASLQPRALKSLASAEYVATHFKNATDLEWSLAVIGLCRAVEVELVARLVQPLAERCAGRDLGADIADAQMGRVASYCAARARTPPELGAIGRFLQTVAHSKKRRSSSELIAQFRELTRHWPNADWLVSERSHQAIEDLTTRFRNPAAHTGELHRADYEDAYDLVAGPSGMLWTLLHATQAPS
jgi:hypothetical protein